MNLMPAMAVSAIWVLPMQKRVHVEGSWRGGGGGGDYTNSIIIITLNIYIMIIDFSSGNDAELTS